MSLDGKHQFEAVLMTASPNVADLGFDIEAATCWFPCEQDEANRGRRCHK